MLCCCLRVVESGSRAGAVKCIRDTEYFSSTLREMCELACSVERDVSDGNSGSSVDDWDHNTWNHLFNILAEYRTGPALLKLLRDEEAGRRGITCHFALDVMDVRHGRIEV